MADLTERKRAEEELRKSQDQLRALAAYLESVREEERTRIARELHDEIGQAVTGIKLLLERVLRAPNDVAANTALALNVANELIAKVRDLSLELRPAMLDQLGLLSALAWYFRRYMTQANVTVEFKHARLERRRFAPAIETAAYRIVQEALTNVARHAGTTEVNVQIEADEATLRIQVKDAGTGFELESLPAGATGGLVGMRERAMMLGGRLEIQSARGAGTLLIAELPLVPVLTAGKAQVAGMSWIDEPR
jgi:signal transduction histidine kinase